LRITLKFKGAKSLNASWNKICKVTYYENEREIRIKHILIKGGLCMKHHGNSVVSGLISDKDLCKLREAVCVQVEKIYDSCKEKDCIEDAPVIFKRPEKVKHLLRKAINVKARQAEVLDVFADVEPVPFKRGFYTVDVKYFIKVVLDFFVPQYNGGTRIETVSGIVLFDKKVILFGSEGGVKIFKSKFMKHHHDSDGGATLQQDNLPMSKVEVAEPIALNAKIEDIFDDCDCICFCADSVPNSILEAIEDDNHDYREEGVETEEDERGHGSRPKRQVVATIGLFSIIKLVRLVQLLVPAFDFCVPNKECVASTDENPCDLFDTIEFPVDEFFPPQKFDFPGAVEEEKVLRDETE
jgi:hypothetical protein